MSLHRRITAAPSVPTSLRAPLCFSRSVGGSAEDASLRSAVGQRGRGQGAAERRGPRGFDDFGGLFDDICVFSRY